jgi:hypothetical protein
MPTLFEVLFVLALVLPPAAVAAGLCTVVGPSLIHWRTEHGGERRVARGPVAVHHPVGR